LINPQNITYTMNKVYTEHRTKQGYFVQYWGENLMDLSYNGITGSFGVEGLKQLFVLYRHEQIAMKKIIDERLSLAQRKTKAINIRKRLGYPFHTMTEMFTSIELHYLGWVFKGYFTNFAFDESIDRLGFFNYSLSMRITSFKNFAQRCNIFPWQYNFSDKTYQEKVKGFLKKYFEDLKSLNYGLDLSSYVDSIYVTRGV